jgi:hypothetical protein
MPSKPSTITPLLNLPAFPFYLFIFISINFLFYSNFPSMLFTTHGPSLVSPTFAQTVLLLHVRPSSPIWLLLSFAILDSRQKERYTPHKDLSKCAPILISVNEYCTIKKWHGGKHPLVRQNNLILGVCQSLKLTW